MKYLKMFDESQSNKKSFIPLKIRNMKRKYKFDRYNEISDEYIEIMTSLLKGKTVKVQCYNYCKKEKIPDVIIEVLAFDFNPNGVILICGHCMSNEHISLISNHLIRGKYYDSFALDEREPIYIEEDINELIKKIQIKKEEQRIKMKDIDPFGEEELDD